MYFQRLVQLIDTKFRGFENDSSKIKRKKHYLKSKYMKKNFIIKKYLNSKKSK